VVIEVEDGEDRLLSYEVNDLPAIYAWILPLFFVVIDQVFAV
jgi:hypothetical protein